MTPEQHAEHMKKVEEGLNQIMQIVQGLLSEEQAEEAAPPEAEGAAPEGGKNLRAMLGEAVSKGQ